MKRLMKFLSSNIDMEQVEKEIVDQKGYKQLCTEKRKLLREIYESCPDKDKVLELEEMVLAIEKCEYAAIMKTIRIEVIAYIQRQKVTKNQPVTNIQLTKGA